MCVDFTDLNKASPKDDFLLPHIDQLVDATGYELICFFGCPLRLPPDFHGQVGRNKDCLHHPDRHILLHQNALQP